MHIASYSIKLVIFVLYPSVFSASGSVSPSVVFVDVFGVRRLEYRGTAARERMQGAEGAETKPCVRLRTSWS